MSQGIKRIYCVDISKNTNQGCSVLYSRVLMREAHLHEYNEQERLLSWTDKLLSSAVVGVSPISMAVFKREI
jgi:hypothetical protein